ncbi:relaxase/mobilization nuclease domain-containing protein [Acutalibacter caecimuris]|uniref:relaxase/mobilization nuclease domain-containing protein n=1 Tax=Acutalibacter caecimuris TaxID=3093657 RepID=UPI0034602AF6
MGALHGVLKYVAQERKTRQGDFKFVSGHNCAPQYAYTEMLTTKRQFRKTDGRQLHHFVQPFSDDDCLTPQEANIIGLELAEREFPNFEVVVATHLGTGHLHNHLVVNSVSCVDGRKFHQNAADLQVHRNANDTACQRHGLAVLKKAERQENTKRMTPENTRPACKVRVGNWI